MVHNQSWLITRGNRQDQCHWFQPIQLPPTAAPDLEQGPAAWSSRATEIRKCARLHSPWTHRATYLKTKKKFRSIRSLTIWPTNGGSTNGGPSNGGPTNGGPCFHYLNGCKKVGALSPPALLPSHQHWSGHWSAGRPNKCRSYKRRR